MNHFADRLSAAVTRCGNPVLVGLDPRWKQLPEPVQEGLDPAKSEDRAGAYQRFCCGVIDVVAPFVSAVKPQMAFFEELGPAGMQALWDVVRHAKKRGLLVILDGKRMILAAPRRPMRRPTWVPEMPALGGPTRSPLAPTWATTA